jgi:hypothetical protein
VPKVTVALVLLLIVTEPAVSEDALPTWPGAWKELDLK